MDLLICAAESNTRRWMKEGLGVLDSIADSVFVWDEQVFWKSEESKLQILLSAEDRT